MQFQIEDSLKEIKTGLQQMQKLQENASKTLDEQKEFELHIRKSHKLSVCLCNLAGLLTEFGPQRPIASMREIESKVVLSAEELKERAFRKVVGAQRAIKEETVEDESEPNYSEYSPMGPERRELRF